MAACSPSFSRPPQGYILQPRDWMGFVLWGSSTNRNKTNPLDHTKDISLTVHGYSRADECSLLSLCVWRCVFPREGCVARSQEGSQNPKGTSSKIIQRFRNSLTHAHEILTMLQRPCGFFLCLCGQPTFCAIVCASLWSSGGNLLKGWTFVFIPDVVWGKLGNRGKYVSAELFL